MKVKELIDFLEQTAPSVYQEDYDNSGLIVGLPSAEIKGVLITLDVTESVISEAVEKRCNVIVAHHPIVFRGLKRLNGKNYVERTVMLAIKNDIAIYAIHTNLDNVINGVNYKIAKKLGLDAVKILSPKSETLYHLTVFVPEGKDSENVIKALHAAGAGNIGDYSECSFQTRGIGRFTPNASANPHIGTKNTKEEVNENRVEFLVPLHLKAQVLQAMFAAHPYEEVAYYLNKLENVNQVVGAGVIGQLEEEMSPDTFLKHLKESMGLQVIRYTSIKKNIKTVAICGGSGSFLLKDALRQQADAFVTADFKYHEFFDNEGQIMIADIGHFESEVFTKDLLLTIISEKFTNFASYLSDINTNPISYHY